MRMFPNLAALLLAVGCTSIFAADETAAPIIVTATRTAQSADATLASVTVITREDLEREQAQSVQDALRNVVGLSLDNNGGMGKATAVFLRGTESDHVLVLIDGVKVGSATLGTTSFQDIPVDQIDRIEIVRGPRSSLYGSEAIGGVIQIFTRKGGGAFTPSFSFGVGSHRSYNASAGISGGGDQGWFNVNTATQYTQGINACSGDLVMQTGCFTNEPDKDGYRNRSGSIHAGYRFGNDIEGDFFLLQTNGKNKYDAPDDYDRVTDKYFELGSNYSRSQQRVGGLSIRVSPTPIWRAVVSAGRSLDALDIYRFDDLFDGRYDTRRDTVSLQNDITLAENQVATIGIDYQKDIVGGTTNYLVASRNNKGVFAQYQIGLGQHDIQLSARSDDNQKFNRRNTYGLMWGHDLAPGVRVKASYGTAFKAPTFNELYYPGFGNDALTPEKSRSSEIGIDGHPTWGRWSVTSYQTQVSGLIAFDPTTYAPANIAVARIVGVESAVAVHIEEWTINANATVLHPENRSNDANRGNVLVRRAEEIANLDVARRFGSFSLGAALHAEGRRYDNLANTTELGGYATVDLRGEYAIAPEWMLQARVANLLNKQYETARYFNQDGRNYFLTVRYQPGVK